MTTLAQKANATASLFTAIHGDEVATMEVVRYLAYKTVKHNIELLRSSTAFVTLPRLRRMLAESFNVQDANTEGAIVVLGNKKLFNAIQISVHPTGTRETLIRLLQPNAEFLAYLEGLEKRWPQLKEIQLPELDGLTAPSPKSKNKIKVTHEAVLDASGNAGDQVDHLQKPQA